MDLKIIWLYYIDLVIFNSIIFLQHTVVLSLVLFFGSINARPNGYCNRCNSLIESDLVARELLDASRSLGESTVSASSAASSSASSTAAATSAASITAATTTATTTATHVAPASATSEAASAASASATSASATSAALAFVVGKVDADAAAADVGARQLDGGIGGLGLLELNVAEALEVAGLAVGGEADLGDGAAVAEGLADRLLVDVPGQVADEDTEAALLLLGGGAGGVDGLGGAVLDGQPAAVEVGPVQGDAGLGVLGGTEVEDGGARRAAVVLEGELDGLGSLAALGEELLDLLLGGAPGQTADVELGDGVGILDCLLLGLEGAGIGVGLGLALLGVLPGGIGHIAVLGVVVRVGIAGAVGIRRGGRAGTVIGLLGVGLLGVGLLLVLVIVRIAIAVGRVGGVRTVLLLGGSGGLVLLLGGLLVFTVAVGRIGIRGGIGTAVVLLGGSGLGLGLGLVLLLGGLLVLRVAVAVRRAGRTAAAVAVRRVVGGLLGGGLGQFLGLGGGLFGGLAGLLGGLLLGLLLGGFLLLLLASK